MNPPNENTASANTRRGGVPRTFAVIIPLIGGAASLALTLYAGRHNHSILLVTLFAIWVLSPYAYLYVILRSAATRLLKGQRVVNITALLLTLGSLCIYSLVALGPHRPRTAAAFLVVPLVSWFVCGVATLGTRYSARSKKAI